MASVINTHSIGPVYTGVVRDGNGCDPSCRSRIQSKQGEGEEFDVLFGMIPVHCTSYWATCVASPSHLPPLIPLLSQPSASGVIALVARGNIRKGCWDDGVTRLQRQ